MPASRLPSACIIGAGSSGIAAAKVFRERAIPFDCFEKGDEIGGNWVFGNRNGVSSAYRGLHINTSKPIMQYSDFPMPAEFPDFCHHTHVRSYFDAYVDHFGVRDSITFETSVERAERRHDGVWEVTLDTGEIRSYDALVVANGHHWDPRWPEPAFPGAETFAGEQMHSHHYVDAKPFEGKRVVVLGMGNSAMDIAVEASYSAERVLLAARRGAHIIPNYLLGRPVDQYPNDPRVPFEVRRRALAGLLRLAMGRPEDYGLPKPDHEVGQAHPTVSNYILTRIAHGEVIPKPNIAALEGDAVRFADGTVEPADVVVYCTGYKVTFPFFDPAFLSAPENALPLYKRVFKPDVENLFFLGLLQPLGAIMPLAEAQAKWVAAYLRGECALPPRAAVERDMARERARMSKRYVSSKRHTMQVDGPDYLHMVEKEMARGARRARARGFRPPVSPRAAAAASGPVGG